VFVIKNYDENKIRKIIYDLSDSIPEDFTENTDLREYLNSIDFIKMVIAIEEVYGINLPDDFLMFEKISTLGKINLNIRELLGEIK